MPPDISAYEQSRVQSFVSALLQHEGALVEAIEPEGLEVLAPPPVQRALGFGELARLGFGTTLPRAAQRVGLEGDWLDRFSKLLGPQGRYARRVLSSTARAPSDPERLLDQELVLDNATFRLLGTTPAWTRYLVFDFRASAVSDDKRDWVVRLGLNLATGALPDAVMTAIAPAVDALQFGSQDATGNGGGALPPNDAELPAMWDRPRVVGLLAQALLPRLDVLLASFLRGLRRRLGRDQDRLHQYHNDLHCQAMRRALVLPDGDPKRRREEQRAEAISV